MRANAQAHTQARACANDLLATTASLKNGRQQQQQQQKQPQHIKPKLDTRLGAQAKNTPQTIKSIAAPVGSQTPMDVMALPGKPKAR